MDTTQLTSHIVPRLIYGNAVVVNTPAVYEQLQELISPATYEDVQVEVTTAVFETQVVVDTPAVIAEARQILLPPIYDLDGVEVTPAVIATGGEVISEAVTHEELVEAAPAVFETQSILETEAVYRTVDGDLITPAKFGVLIPHAVAQMVGFTPDDNWVAETEGYFSTHLRLVVLQRSPVEIYSVQDDPPITRYHGPTVDSEGKVNEYLKSADGEPGAFNIYSRTLVFFVDQDNKFLHDLPLRLDLGKGEGGNFAQALKNYYFLCCRAIFKEANEPMQWLSNEALAHLVFECDLTLDDAGYIAPIADMNVDLEKNYIPITDGGLLSDWFRLSSGFPSTPDNGAQTGNLEELLAYYGVKEI